MGNSNKAYFQDRGQDALGRLLSSRNVFFVTFAFLLLSAQFSFANNVGSGFGENFDAAGNDALLGIACALNGPLGWLLIAFGVLLALWDFFIQKQGHFLILAIVGVLGVIILARSLPVNLDECG